MIHPVSFEDWERWSHSQQRLRRAKHALKQRINPAPELPLHLHQRGDNPRVVVALDHVSGTFKDALLAPLGFIGDAAVVTRGALPAGYLGEGWSSSVLGDVAELPDTLKVVLSPGCFRAVSLPLRDWARARGLRFVVSQHGLLTPFGPPLPDGVELAAWFESDVEYWTAGRKDVQGVVLGSQLLWNAAQQQTVPVGSRPLFLGQLHGAELPRLEVARVSEWFCRTEDAIYRPHPAEKDVVSRAIHRYWRYRRVAFDESGIPLSQSTRPVASIFSTGLLEAAARGLPSWGVHPNPPSWLSELWERYGVGRWGGAPTSAPLFGAVQPAELLASYLTG